MELLDGSMERKCRVSAEAAIHPAFGERLQLVGASRNRLLDLGIFQPCQIWRIDGRCRQNLTFLAGEHLHLDDASMEGSPRSRAE